LARCKLLARTPLAGEVVVRLTLDRDGNATCVCLDSIDSFSDPVVALCVDEELAGLHVEIHRADETVVSLHLVPWEAEPLGARSTPPPTP
jgi:hypothetical protein